MRVSRLAVPLLMVVTVALTLTGGASIVVLLLIGFAVVAQLAPALLTVLIAPSAANRVGAMAGIVTGVGFVCATAIGGVALRDLLPWAPSWLQDLHPGFVGLILNAIVMFASSRLMRTPAGARLLTEADRMHAS